MHPRTPAADAMCIWCGKRLGKDLDGASFLFLARRDGMFLTPPEHWLDASPHLEGHQFFCHAACFRDSVPEGQQYALRLALDEED